MIYMMDSSFTDVLLIESELVKLILDYIHEQNIEIGIAQICE